MNCRGEEVIEKRFHETSEHCMGQLPFLVIFLWVHSMFIDTHSSLLSSFSFPLALPEWAQIYLAQRHSLGQWLFNLYLSSKYFSLPTIYLASHFLSLNLPFSCSPASNKGLDIFVITYRVWFIFPPAMDEHHHLFRSSPALKCFHCVVGGKWCLASLIFIFLTANEVRTCLSVVFPSLWNPSFRSVEFLSYQF